MFKKFITGVLFLFLLMPVWAEVSILSVTDEGKHSQKEDFWHTFEYYVIGPNGKAGKCQATRIAKNWFATAAHCVKPFCKKRCTIRMDLLEQPVSVFVDGKHTASKPIVFIHPSYSGASNIANDFALIKMDLSLLPSYYYRRPAGTQTENVMIPRGEFQRFLKQNPTARREFDRALRPDLPPLLVFGNVTKRIDRRLSVVSIFGGKRNILQNPYPTDYVKEIGFAYTQNFGVKQGMSGSGVMTNTGELAGIISAYLVISTEGSHKKGRYFMFPVFNENLTGFMEETMGSDYYKMDRKDASDGYVTNSPKDHSEILQAAKELSGKK